ncbi:MAG: hypothetical protein EZS28_009989 [Streblomastix strix]|uniref:Uncharacterized protein n=1 Tax=Streblomastix strix TaxID=222440 RepID=A0A5J4WIF6_9EUKA|nr:MAG: hypothetical protein EZS28_009989 [Streblomastix strix]
MMKKKEGRHNSTVTYYKKKQCHPMVIQLKDEFIDMLLLNQVKNDKRSGNELDVGDQNIGTFKGAGGLTLVDQNIGTFKGAGGLTLETQGKDCMLINIVIVIVIVIATVIVIVIVTVTVIAIVIVITIIIVVTIIIETVIIILMHFHL